MRGRIIILVVLFSFLCPPLIPKDDITCRIAIAVGANYGGPGREVLRYAVSDARSFNLLMEKLGGVKSKYSTLLIEPSTAMILSELEKIKQSVLKNKKKGERTEVIFYYSGHSDDEGLLLGRDKLYYKDLRKQIDDLPGDVKIAILDSCSSGAFTRIKGGKMLSPFMSDPSYDMKGYAFLTSSSSDEVSQESEKIKGSFFTHFLLSGLRGAADMTQDGRITLTEAYQYAYKETLHRTEKTSGGAQHPNYQIQMSGTGDVVLTDIRENHSLLTFSDQISGRIYINNDNSIIAEVSKESGEPLSVALDEGKYTLIQQRQGDIYESKISLRKGNKIIVSSNSFTRFDKENTGKRGGTDNSSISAANHTGKSSYDFTIRNNTVGAFLFPVSFNEPGEYESYSFVFHLFGSNCYDINKLCLGLGLSLVKNDAICPSISMIGNIVGHDGGYLAVGGIFNVTSHDFRGSQISAVSNITMNDFNGVQISAITNVIGHDATGAQITGIINIASQDFSGAQIAGIMNVNRNNFSGTQIATLTNVNTGNFSGLQISEVFNYNYETMKGLQLSLINYAGSQYGLQTGIINTCGNQSGVQTGLININNESHGFHIGIINLTDKDEGIPVGLISLTRSGSYHLSSWMDNSGMMYSTLTHYNNYVFNTYGIGYDPVYKKSLSGLGLGVHARKGDFAATFDINSYSYNIKNMSRNCIRLKLHYYFSDRFSLFAGASYNHLWKNDNAIKVATPRGYGYSKQSKSKKHSFWPGLFFGFEI